MNDFIKKFESFLIQNNKLTLCCNKCWREVNLLEGTYTELSSENNECESYRLMCGKCDAIMLLFYVNKK